MKVQIISREVIKPSSPTPSHLRVYKVSILDQLAPNCYIPVVLFYSEACKSTIKISDHLKRSLSKILTRYYQFAGRVKDDYCVDCDDYGATFIEAYLNSKMSEALEKPNLDLLEQLLPCKTYEKLNTQVNLSVQVSHFDCGGVAISFCFKHEIADATAAANFVKSFAAVAYGGSNIKDVIFDCTSLFPQQDLSGLPKSVYENAFPLMDTITKRFMFDCSKIVVLREKIRIINGPSSGRPTRFEAVSALIWGAVIAVAKEKDEDFNTTSVLIIPVNLRKRMNPPLPEQSIGNIFQSTGATWSTEDTIDYNSLAGKIHDSITMMNEDYARKVNEGGGCMNYFRDSTDPGVSSSKINEFCVSSWCRLPLYEADFGWGKPVWVASAFRLNNVAVLLDTSDGQGIEAWVALSEKDMAKLEQDPGILAYACCNPSIL